MRVIGITGSLRRASYNRALLNAAMALAPQSLTIVPVPLDAIPLYNGDVDTDQLRPADVVKLILAKFLGDFEQWIARLK
jgi:chromate reductase